MKNRRAENRRDRVLEPGLDGRPGKAGTSSRSASQASASDPLERGLELIRAGEFFAAHEELEDAWRAAEPPERDFLQGLVHVAVAWYQAGRGNRVGCERQLEKARRRLTPYAAAHRGVDIDALLRQLEAASVTVAKGSLELARPSL